VSRGGADVLVRVNRPWRLAVRDVEAAVCEPVTALVLPKADSAEHVRALAEVVESVEAERGLTIGHTRLFPRVESPAGLDAAAQIAAAHPRVVAIGLGSSDYTIAAGMVAGGSGNAFASFLVVNAARRAGVLPIGLVSSIVDFSDLDAFRRVCEESRDLGLRGAPCVHPSQVPILNEVFAPTEAELAGARRIVKEYEQALAEGVGAITVDGVFVDAPFYEQAKRILAG
jgi:citrate lyase subunit beta/citryl-CoA lyase